jgi:predicted MFS family arabinose efflux permease
MQFGVRIMLRKISSRLSNVHRDVWLFVIAIAIIGFAGQIVESTFNNFLSETYKIGGLKRSVLELPRELPGFSVVFVSALLCFLPGRRLAAFAMILQAVGLVLLAFCGSVFSAMLAWLFIMSLGQHLFIALQNSIGMELAHEGQEGRRLGQFSSVRNIASLAGCLLVYVGFKYMHFSFAMSFIIAAATLLVASGCFMGMTPVHAHKKTLHLKLHREYRLFYWLSILFGTRKQIFITFAPWVLVTVFDKPTYTIAWLYILGGVAGIVFQPFLGWMIDRMGERFVLVSEAVTLVFVCLGYGFAKSVFPDGNTAYVIAAVCFVIDMLMISAGMARATYLKKIAIHPSHVAPTLTMGVSIDHVFSIGIAFACGFIWNLFGFQYVFLLGAFIAFANMFSAMRIRIPGKVLKEEEFKSFPPPEND